jgi:hypothetical protein
LSVVVADVIQAPCVYMHYKIEWVYGQTHSVHFRTCREHLQPRCTCQNAYETRQSV